MPDHPLAAAIKSVIRCVYVQASTGGQRTGFTEMLDEVVTIAEPLGDAALGSAIRRALGVATDGP